MGTHSSTWKARERQAAALFGARRQRCSGSSGRDDLSRSDSTHPRLFLEVKLRAKFPFRVDFDEVRAQRKGKSPFGINVARRLSPFAVLVTHSDDLDVVLDPVEVLRVYQASDRPSAIRSLFQATEKLAAAEGKTAVVLVATKGRPGFLVAFRLDQIETIRRERCIALGQIPTEAPDPAESRGEAA